MNVQIAGQPSSSFNSHNPLLHINILDVPPNLHADLNWLASPVPPGGWQGGRRPAGGPQRCGASAWPGKGFWEMAETALLPKSPDEVLLDEVDHRQHAAAGERWGAAGGALGFLRSTAGRTVRHQTSVSTMRMFSFLDRSWTAPPPTPLATVPQCSWWTNEWMNEWILNSASSCTRTYCSTLWPIIDSTYLLLAPEECRYFPSVPALCLSSPFFFG